MDNQRVDKRSGIMAIGLLLSLAGSGTGCGVEQREHDGPTGQLRMAIAGDDTAHDVVFIAFKVVHEDESCDDDGLASVLERESLSTGGGSHRFSDHLFVLAPGRYRACATPLTDNFTPSRECERAEGVVTVSAGTTTEIMLVSQCHGTPNGAGDVIVTLNDPPRIDDLLIDRSKFIQACERVVITAEAHDPNGDTLTTTWAIVSHPPGGAGRISGSGAFITFTPDAIGDYTLMVTVSDPLGGTASLMFPIHASSCWLRGADILTPREGYAAAAVNGILYYIAGNGPGGDSTINEAYDPRFDEWSTRASLDATPRAEMAAVSDGTYVYVVGGRLRVAPAVTNELWRYDPLADSWLQLPSMHTARATEYMAAFEGGRIYVVGGRTTTAPGGGGELSSVEVFDIASQTWLTAPPMPEPRSDALVLAQDGHLYVFGGYGPSDLPNEDKTDTTFIFDIAQNTWRRGANLPPPAVPTELDPDGARVNLTGAVCAGRLHVIGGSGPVIRDALNVNNWVYDPATNSWRDEEPVPRGVTEVQAVSSGDKIYVVGGGVLGLGINNRLNQIYTCRPPSR